VVIEHSPTPGSPVDATCPRCHDDLVEPIDEVECTPISNAPPLTHVMVCTNEGIGFIRSEGHWTEVCTFDVTTE